MAGIHQSCLAAMAAMKLFSSLSCDYHPGSLRFSPHGSTSKLCSPCRLAFSAQLAPPDPHPLSATHSNVHTPTQSERHSSSSVGSSERKSAAWKPTQFESHSSSSIGSSQTHSNVDAPTQFEKHSSSSIGSSQRMNSAWKQTLDKNGRLRSPRAARELALCVLYAGLASDRNPLSVFKQRLKQTSGNFNADLLTSYNHLTADGDSIFVEDAESVTILEQKQDEESLLEAAVLTAPPSLVYNKFVLNMAERIIQSTADSWSQQEIILKDLLPERWKATGGIMVQLCILHMAMAEMVKMGTSPRIVIDEAVELTKRFSDGAAARIVNGCLGKFVLSPYFQERQVAEDDGAVLNKEGIIS